jgi:hypothetical protein
MATSERSASVQPVQRTDEAATAESNHTGVLFSLPASGGIQRRFKRWNFGGKLFHPFGSKARRTSNGRIISLRHIRMD